MSEEDYWRALKLQGYIGQILVPLYIIPGVGAVLNYYYRKRRYGEADFENDVKAYAGYLVTFPFVIGPFIMGAWADSKLSSNTESG